MHQQPPRPRQETEAIEAEPSTVSRPGDAARHSKAGSMIGRPPLLTHAAQVESDRSGQEGKLPARSMTSHTSPVMVQQEGLPLSLAAPVGGHGQGLPMTRFAGGQAFAPSGQPSAQQSQWSVVMSDAAAHVQAVQLLLEAAQQTSNHPAMALQHLQSVSLLCQSCLANMPSGQTNSRAAVAAMQSIQSICETATEESLAQPHAQHALWVSLRQLCRTIAQPLES